MNAEPIKSYIEEIFKKLDVRKTILNAISFFLTSALNAKTLVPTKVGRQTLTALPRNGVKRVERLLNNKFFTMALIDEIYCFVIKQLVEPLPKIKLEVDWTIIREKFCFLSISLVLNQGRSIPLYFTGYIKKELSDEDSQSYIEKELLK